MTIYHSSSSHYSSCSKVFTRCTSSYCENIIITGRYHEFERYINPSSSHLTFFQENIKNLIVEATLKIISDEIQVDVEITYHLT